MSTRENPPCSTNHLQLVPDPVVDERRRPTVSWAMFHAEVLADENEEKQLPTAVSNGLRRPVELIELDGRPLASWVLRLDAAYIWEGRRWRQEKVGCVLCCEMADDRYATLSSIDDRPETTFICMEHGELCAVPYSMSKIYTVKIGDVTRTGEEWVNDVMLFPLAMDVTERDLFVEKLLDQAQTEEAESGPSPCG